MAEENQTPVVKTTKTITVPSDFQGLINDIKASGTVAQKSLVVAIENYMNVMSPEKLVDSDAGARYQYTLWKIISNLCENSPPEEFKRLWYILLNYFNTYKLGVFHERYVYRFSEFWIWTKDELDGFQRIINVIKLTADPKDRQNGLKQVSLDRSMEVGFTDEARQRVINYYHN